MQQAKEVSQLHRMFFSLAIVLYHRVEMLWAKTPRNLVEEVWTPEFEPVAACTHAGQQVLKHWISNPGVQP